MEVRIRLPERSERRKLGRQMIGWIYVGNVGPTVDESNTTVQIVSRPNLLVLIGVSLVTLLQV